MNQLALCQGFNDEKRCNCERYRVYLPCGTNHARTDSSGSCCLGRWKAAGILTERDLVRKVLANNLNPIQTKVSEIMLKPLLSANPDISIGEAARIVVDNRIRRLPIVDEDRLVRIITAVDLARYLAKITHEMGGKVDWAETLWNAILRNAAR